MKTSEIYLAALKAVLIAELAPEVTVTDDVALRVGEIIYRLYLDMDSSLNYEAKYEDNHGGNHNAE